MRATGLALLLVCLTALSLGSHETVESHSLDAVDVPLAKAPLDGASAPVKGRMSLVELAHRSKAAAMGLEVMTDQMEEKAKHDFVKLAASFKSPKLRAKSLATVRIAQEVLLGEGDAAKTALGEAAKTKGSGLDLIFRKLNELKKEIEDEQKLATTTFDAKKVICQKDFSDADTTIADTSKKMSDNNKAVKDSKDITIPYERQAFADSRKLELDNHKFLTEMYEDRDAESAKVRADVDDKTKAVDVLVKASFLVCERFPRYKTTPQCKEILSQPDIDEPQRYVTKPFDDAKLDTEAFHASKLEDGTDNPWYIKWEAQMVKDGNKVGHKDPEELLGPSYLPAAPTDAPTAAGTPAPSAAPGSTEQFFSAVTLLDMSDDSEHENADYSLSEDEAKATDELQNMGREASLNIRYARPLVELGEAIKSGSRARSRSIVEILLQVLKEIRDEIALAKAEFQVKMDDWFDEGEDFETIMKDQAALQATAKTSLDTERKMISDKQDDSFTQGNLMRDAQSTKLTRENECWAEEETFGVTEAINNEDLENLIKLKSLLRGLYDKAMPKNCLKHNFVMCTSFDNGWCVYIHEKASQGNAQRCSCNVGFYGDKCEFKMCPGLGASSMVYPAQPDPLPGGTEPNGVCSNRGTCDPLTGLCTCWDMAHEPLGIAYYHGPKNACDFQHAPESCYGQDPDSPANFDYCLVDDQCSGHGTVDRVRGSCACQLNWFGPSCAERMCPNKNTVKYARSSALSCSGHGTCSIFTGGCTCDSPYYSSVTGPEGSCELERCQGDCNGHGACTVSGENAGKCACDPANLWGGTRDGCEWYKCNQADDDGGGHGGGCGSAMAGWCNRNDGKCLCHMGYSGYKCDKTVRCTAATLFNANMNWWTIWDNPGWLVCPFGQLMYRLRRSDCQALSCLDSGGCAAACEGTDHVFQIRHCYHDLRWYTDFDEAGWATCLDDYFVAGFFRSCESLYCLNMAKCCSLKEARQPGALCSSSTGSPNAHTIWNADFDNSATPVSVPDNTFITGLRRSDGHELKNIESASYCGWVRGY